MMLVPDHQLCQKEVWLTGNDYVPRDKGAIPFSPAVGTFGQQNGIPQDALQTPTLGPSVECSGDNENPHCEGKKTGSRLGNGDVELLFQAIYTSEKETHAHNKQQIRQHAADEGSLDNDNFVLEQGDDRYNQFHSIP